MVLGIGTAGGTGGGRGGDEGGGCNLGRGNTFPLYEGIRGFTVNMFVSAQVHEDCDLYSRTI